MRLSELICHESLKLNIIFLASIVNYVLNIHLVTPVFLKIFAFYFPFPSLQSWTTHFKNQTKPKVFTGCEAKTE